MSQDELEQSPHWEEKDSANFIEYGNFFVPERELQIDAICSVIPSPPSASHLVDLCCGEGVLAAVLLDRFSDCYVHGYDGSSAMLDKARQRLGRFGQRFDTTLFELAASNWRHMPWLCHAVVSSLAIHHLTDAEKQQLFVDVYSLLAQGGAFVIADVLQPRSEQATSFAARKYDDVVKEQSLRWVGNMSAYERFIELGWNAFSLVEPDPIDKMAPLFAQLKWLEQAGFADVDVYWMKAGHAVFGGYKR